MLAAPLILVSLCVARVIVCSVVRSLREREKLAVAALLQSKYVCP